MEIKKVNFSNVPNLSSAKRSADAAKPATDGVSFSGSTALEGALASTPDSRPEAVARAKELIGDSNYPPADVIKKVSQLLAEHTAAAND